MFVGIFDTAVVLFLEFVLNRVRCRITTLPEAFNELIALLVIRELLEGCALLVRNNPAHIFVQPFLVRLAQLLLQRLRVLTFLLFGDRPLEWIYFLRALRLR